MAFLQNVKYATGQTDKKEGEIMNFFRDNLEKDFEFFIKSLPMLEPIEFCGLAKIFGVSMVYEEKLADFSREEYGEMELEEKTQYMAQFNRPMDKILEDIMDKYLALPRRKRKEINQMMKDIKRGK